MTTTRRTFLKTTTALGVASRATFGASTGSLDGARIARRHRLVTEQPTPNFFEGMLLGNGDIGVCVTVRPDAMGLHIGKEDSWDIRVSEDHYQHVLDFKDLLQLWKRAGDEAKRQGKPDMLFLERNIDFFREYRDKVRSSYAKVWPRPWPCGIVWIHWDSRMVRVVRQELDPSQGLLTIHLEHDDLRGSKRAILVWCFVNWQNGHICVRTNVRAPFLSVAYYPHLEDETGLPPPEIDARAAAGHADFSAYQHFPASPPSEETPHPPKSHEDRNFMLCGRVQGAWTVEGLEQSQEQLRRSGIGSQDNYTSYEGKPRTFLRSKNDQLFRLDLTLFTPRDRADNVGFARTEVARLSRLSGKRLQQETARGWKEFWSRSAVEFEDRELERIWYRNQYFLACCLREGKMAPGLFGNWTSGNIGTAWHGDYHMNYNTQQIFWGVFSSNHVEQHLPYVELCENLLEMSQSFARDKLGMPGAFFPHSAYPVPSQINPYPVPPWGYEVCETPWTVQSLWWHYLYTQDRDFLTRVYPLLRAAARFVTAYVTREDDSKYHIVPSVSPENWGCTVDFRLNKDCIIDLALTEFLLDATVEASEILEVDAGERSEWAKVRADLAPYPKATGPFGEVWLDVVNAPVEHVYNVPCTLAPVFPAEQVGIGRRQEQLEIARRTASVLRLEGGNDLVFQPLIRARLGMLDMEWFKNEVRYCLKPNGVANLRVRQIGGRYKDSTDFDFMMEMGIWIESLSLPAVLNECLLQSYTGTIRLFPNRTKLGPARFEDLRAVGAFLVSASYDGTNVGPVTIQSEKGIQARLHKPWGDGPVRVTRLSDQKEIRSQSERAVVRFPTDAGQGYRVEPA